MPFEPATPVDPQRAAALAQQAELDAQAWAKLDPVRRHQVARAVEALVGYRIDDLALPPNRHVPLDKLIATEVNTIKLHLFAEAVDDAAALRDRATALSLRLLSSALSLA